MLPNEHLISRLTPNFCRDGFLFFSNSHGDIYKLHINSLNLYEENLIVFYHCNLFTLEQKQQENIIKTKITFNKLNIVYHDNSLPELDDFSLCYNTDTIEVILFFNESNPKTIQYTPQSKKVECRGYFDDSLMTNMIDSKNNWKIDTECNTISFNNCIVSFDTISCISDSGVIYTVETDNSVDIFFLATNKDFPVVLSEEKERPISALYDEFNHSIYIILNKNCQQYINVYDFNKHSIIQDSSIKGRLFGTIQPIQIGNKIMFFITGSSEGGYLYDDKTDHKIPLFPGNPDLRRLYYNDNKVKILSIVSSEIPRLNIIFLHGGPESLEWDNPRLPRLINSLSTVDVNFHIVNYAGSKGFWRIYRESVNQNVLQGTISPIINWINGNSPNTDLVLIGGSFGGTLALELLRNAYKIRTNILALVLTNPLLDLPFHMTRVQNEGGDINFFIRKFSPLDISSITVKRYANTLITQKVKTLFLLGRHDEVLTIKPAIALLKKLKGTQTVTANIDDGAHSSLQSSLIREDKMVSFLLETARHCWRSDVQRTGNRL